MLNALKKTISFVITLLYNIRDSVIDFFRQSRYRLVRMRLKNQNPTIIAVNCIGSIVYHNLGLRFNSPTINLYFTNDEFFSFVENLQGFLAAELIEVNDANEPFPVGRLECNEKTVDVFFAHYKTFEEAKNKWDERKKRVDFSNIYIIHMIDNVSESEIRRFEKIPFENKMLIADKNPCNSKYVCQHNVFLRKDYRPGMIILFKNKYSLTRHIDDVDYISFLNQGVSK